VQPFDWFLKLKIKPRHPGGESGSATDLNSCGESYLDSDWIRLIVQLFDWLLKLKIKQIHPGVNRYF